MKQVGCCNSFEGDAAWVILSPIEQSIKQKIEAVGTPLKDWDIQINYGIKTGCNEAFIVSTEKRNEILANCQTEDERKRTEELIRPTTFSKRRKVASERLPAVPFSNLWMVVKPSPVSSATSFWVRLHLILYSLNLTPSKRTNSGVEYSYKSAIIFHLFIYHYNDIYPLYQPLSSIY